MAINFPKFETLDYGNVLGNVEAIKGARLRNQVLGAQLDEHENVIANRQKAAQIRQHFATLPDQVEALEQAGMFEEADRLRDSGRQSAAAVLQMMQSFSDGLTEENYKTTIQQLISMGAAERHQLPVEFEEFKPFLRRQQRELRGAISKLTRRRVRDGVEEEQEIFQQDGEIIAEEPFYETGESMRDRTSGEDGRLSPADSNSIRSAVHSAGFFKTSFNPATGELSILDSSQARDVLSLVDAATRFYREGKAKSHNEAVTMAWNALQEDLQGEAAVQGRDAPEDRRTRTLFPSRDPAGIR